MEIIKLVEKLPDDIILHIYTKCLKRYRIYNGTLIKLIDFDKYKFLEKYIYRKIKAFNQLKDSWKHANIILFILFQIKQHIKTL